MKRISAVAQVRRSTKPYIFSSNLVLSARMLIDRYDKPVIHNNKLLRSIYLADPLQKENDEIRTLSVSVAN